MPATAQGPSPATLFFQHLTRLAFKIDVPQHAQDLGSHVQGDINTCSVVSANSLDTDNAALRAAHQPNTRDNIEPEATQLDWSRMRPLF